MLRDRIARAAFALLTCAIPLRVGAQAEPAPDPLAAVEALEPDDPLFAATGSWGQTYENQWALRRIGCIETGTGRSAWDAQSGRERPVIVAVLDTGVDHTHPELAGQLWSDPAGRSGMADAGRGNEDRSAPGPGWNFADDDPRPWDDSGHGTYLAGIIAAATHNATGMAGVNPGARILALKVLDADGLGTQGALASALDHATRQGVRVILLGFGGEAGDAVRAAVARALAGGAVIVVPAGDTGREIEPGSLAALPGVIAVGASDRGDARAPFSAWGPALGLIAPGVDVLGLRARGSDWLARSGAPDYRARAAQLGADSGYYRASSSAAAAALVAGAASLLVAAHPELDSARLARVLRQSARDLGPPGFDVQTGYGLLDARAALEAEPEHFIEARIDAVQVLRGDTLRLRVVGSADADLFQNARLLAAPATDSQRWIRLGRTLNSPVRSGVLAELETELLDGAPGWLLRLEVRHADGSARESRFALDLGW